MTSKEFQAAVQRDIQAAIQRAMPRPTAQQLALAARAHAACPTCLGAGTVDVGRGDTESLVACACTEAPADEAPAPTRRRYTFSVYLEVPEPVDEDDCDGYTRKDVEALMERVLSSYAWRRESRGAIADWDLMDSEAVAPAAARR